MQALSARLAGTLLALLLSGACTVVSIDEDKARRDQRSGTFDAQVFVERAWSNGIASHLQSVAVAYEDLSPRLAADLQGAGKAHGRRTTEESPWAFVVTGEATVSAVNRTSKIGTLTLAPASGGEDLTLLAGPVVLTSVLRDALPMFDFNNFSDQMSFAAANRALNAKALAANAAMLDSLKVGDRLRYTGVISVGGDVAGRAMLPIRIERSGG